MRLFLLLLALLPCLSALAGGCGPGVGFVVRPIPADQGLRETVVRRDPGLFVPDKIAVIDVDGLILNQRQSTLLSSGENPVSLFVEKLDAAEADKHVKAVVLRINSPGGGVTASDIMYRRLMELRNRRGLPVVAIIEDVGASGGYYLACGADEILAHPTSVVGSIGVIVQTVSIAGTMQKLGIQSRAIVSGPFKDLASPFKPLRKEDLQILQGMVDDFYARFLAVVEAGRPKLTAEQVRQLADGRVYTAVQACENGLIDAAGYMPEAVQRAKALAGSERVRVVIYHRPWGYAPNAYAASPSPAARGPSTQINLLNVQAHTPWLAPQPRFLYLWTGHTHAPQR